MIAIPANAEHVVAHAVESMRASGENHFVTTDGNVRYELVVSEVTPLKPRIQFEKAGWDFGTGKVLRGVRIVAEANA